MLRKILTGMACAVLLCGCVSYEYTGKTATPTEGNPPIFADSGKVPRPYSVLGQATVSGNYQDVSRDRLVEKLLSEGRRCGADAILLVEQQVVPAGEPRNAPVFMTAYDYDDTNRSWSQLYRDVNQNFGSIRQNNAAPAGSQNVTFYRRVIRAEFLKYTAAAAPDAPQVKPAGK